MLRRTVIVVATTILLAIPRPGSEAASLQYSRDESFGPVGLTYAQLWRTLDRVRSLIDSANATTATDRPPYQTLTLSDGLGVSYELNGAFSLDDLSGGPQLATEARYAYLQPDAPISKVELRLGDYARESTVSGTAREHVDAVAGLIANDIGDYSAFPGGAGHRSTLFFLTAMFFLLLGPIARDLGRSKLSAIGYSTAIALMLSVVFVPWDRFLPGTSISLGDASWLERHSAQFSFWGLVAGVVGIGFAAYGVVRLGKKSRAAPPSDPGSAPPAA